ncbi:hypothetical protein AB6A40_010362 [Gnathostoma spinigerum]|uniref:Peptidase M14 carboxypeptidase A domain-containing protein n=1 Tax=Gnathostoma spinigerum TaxID=75299 RepID=A0ABD6F1L0_9BILA
MQDIGRESRPTSHSNRECLVRRNNEPSYNSIVYNNTHSSLGDSIWVMEDRSEFSFLNFSKVIESLSNSSKSARKLRQRFVFNLLPMLNPDVVLNGSHRYSLTDVDLNRAWDGQSEIFHPTVCQSKELRHDMFSSFQLSVFRLSLWYIEIKRSVCVAYIVASIRTPESVHDRASMLSI